MTDQTTATAGQDTKTRAACLQRLATALCGYPDLQVTVREEGPAPCLAARNTAVPHLSETVTVTEAGDRLAYTWSWGEPIAGTCDPGSAAHAIAYVLQARGAKLGAAR
jgi:hypothetical protein